MSPFESIDVSPFCVHLRSKKLVFQTHPPREDSDILDASGHTWCRLTEDTIGKDGEPCDPKDCQRGRRCFESYNSESS